VHTHRKHIDMVAALRDDHWLARKKSLRRADLLDETLILPAGRPGDPTVAPRIRPSGGDRRGPVRLVPSTLGVLTLAATGMGIAVFPADTQNLPLARLAYRPIIDLDGPALTVLSRPDETLGSVLAFLRLIRETRPVAAPDRQPKGPGHKPATSRPTKAAKRSTSGRSL
jgi:DNA-binding transcriptional LysR family regulator